MNTNHDKIKPLVRHQDKFKFKRGDTVIYDSTGTVFKVDKRIIDVNTGELLYYGYDNRVYIAEVVDELYRKIEN